MRTLSDLIPKVIAATEKGKLAWTQQMTVYSIRIGDLEIRTWEWSDPGSEETTGITIQLLDGITVLDDVVTTEYGPKFPEAKDLFAAARRSALKVDTIIGKMSDFIDNL